MTGKTIVMQHVAFILYAKMVKVGRNGPEETTLADLSNIKKL